MAAKKQRIGSSEGKNVEAVTLDSGDASITIMNLGCVIRDWRVDADGKAIPCVLGFGEFDDYMKHARYHGAICGRVANRIGNSSFSVGGKSYDLPPNEGAHQLHGGAKGLHSRVWDMEVDGDSGLEFTYQSPDGEMGYPGAVDFRVTMALAGSTLTIEMFGRPTEKTPINLAQHNYYNLNGSGDVLGQVLQIASDMYTPTDGELIPTGEMLPVGGTHLDFRTPVLVGERDHGLVGIDSNLVLRDGHNPDKPIVSLWSEDTGLELQLWTEQPGLQVFNGPKMQESVPGHDGVVYGPFGGLCLEPQNFPDAINRVDWPNSVYAPDAPYYQRLVLDIAPQF